MADCSHDPGARRPAPRAPWPVRGQVITFLHAGSSAVPEFARAVATGDVIVDPDTGTRWLPVIQFDLAPALLDATTVIDLNPVREPPQPPGDDHADGQGPGTAA